MSSRFHYADSRVVIASDDAIPESHVLANYDGRTFYRRRYAMNRGFYGPVLADDWHENGCPCRGCVARYHPVEEPDHCLGFANGCACDACFERGKR